MERRIVSRWREKVERGFHSHSVDRVTARAHFVDDHILALDSGDQVTGDFILIATGSSPRPMDFAPVDGQRIHDSDSILRIAEIPETLIILGGGVIACEYASIMQALGVQVTLYNSQTRLLGWLDEEAALLLESIFEQAGMVIHHGARAVATSQNDKCIRVQLDDGTMAQADMCFLGLGRTPNTQNLGLDAAGVAVDARGAIAVDGFMRTNVPHIYAAGDCTSYLHPFAGKPVRLESVQNANDQGRSAAAAIANNPKPYVNIPWFWSIQYDVKLQLVGLREGCDETVQSGKMAANNFSLFHFRNRQLRAVESVNRPIDYIQARKILAAGISPSPEEVADKNFNLKDFTT